MKKLYLSDTDKKFLGVCGGLAEYFEIDSTIVRLVWILIIFIPPFPGILLYLLAGAIIPKRPYYID